MANLSHQLGNTRMSIEIILIVSNQCSIRSTNCANLEAPIIALITNTNQRMKASIEWIKLLLDSTTGICKEHMMSSIVKKQLFLKELKMITRCSNKIKWWDKNLSIVIIMSTLNLQSYPWCNNFTAKTTNTVDKMEEIFNNSKPCLLRAKEITATLDHKMFSSIKVVQMMIRLTCSWAVKIRILKSSSQSW